MKFASDPIPVQMEVQHFSSNVAESITDEESIAEAGATARFAPFFFLCSLTSSKRTLASSFGHSVQFRSKWRTSFSR